MDRLGNFLLDAVDAGEVTALGREHDAAVVILLLAVANRTFRFGEGHELRLLLRHALVELRVH